MIASRESTSLKPGLGYSDFQYVHSIDPNSVLLTFEKRAFQWFRREPEAQKQRDIKLLTHLVADVRQRMGAGTIPDCLTVQALENQGKEGMSDLFLAYSVSSPFGAGIETVSCL